MTPIPRPRTEIADTPKVEVYGDREARLRDARRFRREQIAGLEHGLTQGHDRSDTVRALLMAARTALRDIDRALDQMARGTYGRCVTCGNPIPEEKLEVLPMAAQCTACHYNDQNCRRSA